MPPHTAATVRRLFFAGAALLGCAGNLEPAPESRRVPGIASSAVDEDKGIELVAVADAWRGYPGELDELVTPILVTVTNTGRRPLELRYEHFALVTPSGVRFAALPPVLVNGVAYGPVDLAYPPMGFGLAPYLSPWYPALSVWGGSFPFRADYYGNCYNACQHFPLPDGELLQRALPEGVLSPGGRITGFLYFEELEDVRHINLMAELVDPTTGERFGGLDIPFVYDG